MFKGPQQSPGALVQFSPLAVLELNSDGKIERWNGSAERIFGWAESEVLGRANPSLAPGDTLEYGGDLLRVLAGSTIDGKEVRRLHKDGRCLEAKLWAAPIRNQQNEISGILTILEDITDKKENERKLREFQTRREEIKSKFQASEERMRLALDMSNIGCWDWNVVTGEMAWSHTASRQMGLPEDSPTSLKIFVHSVHPDDRKAISEALERALTCNTAVEVPYRILWPDGSLHWRSLTGRAFHDPSGTPARVVGIAMDIENRKAAEDRLQLQSAALQAAANAIVITDSNGTILWANHAFSTLTGYAPDEVLGNNPRLLKSGVQDRVFYNNLWATITSGNIWQGEISNRRKDGTVYTEEMTITPVHVGKGGITHYVAIKQDVTLRKIAEDRLRQAEEKYRAIFENAAIGIFQFTPEGQPISVNHALARMYGCDSPEQFVTEVQSVDQLFVDLDALQRYRDVLKKERVLNSAEFETLCKDGRKKWVLGCVRTVLDAAGKPFLHEGMIQDITERKQTESLLRERAALEEQLTMIMGMVPGAVYSFRMRPDGSATIPFASARLRDILGSLAGTVEPDAAPLLAMIHPDDRARVQASITHSFRELTPWRDEFRVIHPKKGTVWVEANSLPARQQDGGVLWHGFVLDVTERRRLEFELRQAQRMEALGRLAGGIAHDFNNMMSVVIGYSDVIAETLPSSDPSLPQISKIKDAAHRASALTRQLLAFGRLQTCDPILMNLNVYIAEAANLLRRLLGEDIQLVVLQEQNLWSVNADPSQIDQILMNLAVNARDAMPSGGELVIETNNVALADSYTASHPGMHPGPYVMISVADTGVGMSPEVVPKIFEPFFTTKNVGKGRGLGLSTVYGIVKQSGGFIGVCSEVGVGTTFKVYLPRVVAPTQLATPKEEDSKMGPIGPKTILLVEDEPALREIAKLRLLGFGCTVLEAGDGPEAIRIAEQEAGSIDLLLTDVMMPGMNGRELADRLLQRLPWLKVLFVSGYNDETIFRTGCLEPGANFIRKPYTRMDLEHKLRKVFASQEEVARSVNLAKTQNSEEVL
jgi:two-component system, cell cycle sensor histidine kinase and response regulator CckA